MSTPEKDLEVLKMEEFALQLRGKLTLPQDSDYDEERKVYNGMINKHPGMLVKCVDVADVIYA